MPFSSVNPLTNYYTAIFSSTSSSNNRYRYSSEESGISKIYRNLNIECKIHRSGFTKRVNAVIDKVTVFSGKVNTIKIFILDNYEFDVDDNYIIIIGGEVFKELDLVQIINREDEFSCIFTFNKIDNNGDRRRWH